MKIAIVEDSPEELHTLVSCMTQYSKENELPIEITTFSDGLQFVDRYSTNFDIIYFDVEMPLMDGMTAAKKIRKLDEDVLIVFVTNYVQWAIEGYSVNARDFLLKPLTYFNFKEHFNKIVTKMARKGQATLTLKVNNGYRKVNIDDIYYIENEGHYLNLYLLNNDLKILETMKKMDERLSDYSFYRCHNGYMVNLKHVTGIEKNIVKLGKFEIPISRPRKKEFLSTLTNYLGNEER